MAGRPVFNLTQLALVAQAIRHSEAIVARHYRIPMLPSKQYPYEVVTLSDLAAPERAASALAHLVVYERQRPSGTEYLYRICLQDDAILRRAVYPPGSAPAAIQAPGTGVAYDEADAGWLVAMLVYILTHELVHVVRFQRAEQSFQAPRRARRHEEHEVHRITLQLLEQAKAPHWERLSELHGNPVHPARLVH